MISSPIFVFQHSQLLSLSLNMSKMNIHNILLKKKKKETNEGWRSVKVTIPSPFFFSFFFFFGEERKNRGGVCSMITWDVFNVGRF